MCLNFGGAESKVVGVARYLLGPVRVRDQDGDVGRRHPPALLGRVVPGEERRLDPAPHNPLDGGGGVGVGRFAGQGHGVVDAGRLGALDGHLVRGD